MEHFLAGSFYINSFNQILREVAGGVGGRTGMEWWWSDQRCTIFKIRYTSLTGHFRACVVLIAFDPTGSEDLLLLQLDRSLPSYIGRTGAWRCSTNGSSAGC